VNAPKATSNQSKSLLFHISYYFTLFLAVLLAFVALKRKASGFALRDKALLRSMLAYTFLCEHFLDRICIFHPQGMHNTRECDRVQGFADEILKMAKGTNQEKIPRIPRATSPKLIKRSITSTVAPSHVSQGGSRNSQPGRSWRSRPPPSSTLSGLRSPLPSTAVTIWTL
jgi:hypothetical protein